MLDRLLSQDRREEIRDKDEYRAVMDEHMDGIGLFIRNEWLRSGDRRLFTQLQGFTLGPYDGMSTVIMKAYWHRLRGLPYDPKTHGDCFHVDYPAFRPGFRSAASAAQYADYVQKLACK